MRTGNYIFSLVLLLLLQTDVVGQYAFRHINKRDGLSQNSVFCIEQDNHGFIWLGTRDGLNRYDGYKMVVYRHQDGDSTSVAGNDIRCLYFDKQHQVLWVGTSNGLSWYRSNKDDFVSYVAGSSSGQLLGGSIRSVIRDRQGRLWVGTNRGLHLFDDEQERFQVIRSEAGATGAISSNNIKVIYEDLEGQIWIGTENGLNRLVRHQDSLFIFERVLDSTPVKLSGQHIKTITQGIDRTYWIGTHSQGLFRWDAKANKLKQYRHQKGEAHSLSHDNVRTVQLSPDGNILVGTFVGLNRYRPETDDFEVVLNDSQEQNSLSNSSVRSVFFDHRGSMWVGTYYGGVDYYDQQINRFRNLEQHPDGKGLSHGVVSSFWENDDGSLWIGTEGGGLNLFNRETGRVTYLTTDTKLSGNNVKTLLEARGDLWIGFFSEGLDRLDLETGEIKNYHFQPSQSNGLPSDNVYGLLSAGNELWIASYGGGVSRMHMETEQFQTFQHDPEDSESLCSDLTRVLFRDKAGQYWVGTDEGLDCFVPDSLAPTQKFRHFLSGSEIYALCQSKNGHIWVGTYSDGLFQMGEDGAIIQQFTEELGLPGHTIFGILEGGDGHIWLSTNNGLAKLDRRDNTFTAYNYSDGIRNLEFNFNAYYKTSTGELLFGGTKGATLFKPEDIRLNTFVPPLVFTGLKSFNQPVKVGGEQGLLDQAINHTASLAFAYNRANFSLNFSALDYLNPSNNNYVYKLDGVDDEWTFAKGETEATYTLQRPGTYLFRLRGANNDGVWNPMERHISIEVLPPPWRTNWAYLGYLLVFALILLGMFRFLRLRHQLDMEALEKRQQEELHQAKLRFFTNIAHEFRTPLTLIIGPLEDLVREQLAVPIHRKLVSVEYNAKRLLYLVNQLLNFRKLETDHEHMQAAEGNIVRFLQEIYLSFQEHARSRRITYDFHTEADPVYLYYDRDKMEKVIFNLLSNAFKFTPEGGRIALRLEKEAGAVVVIVEDSGKGVPAELHEQIFKRFYEKEATFRHSFKGTGIGLAVSRQLVKMHHGTISLESEEGQGAVFKVRLPLGMEHLEEKELIRGFQDSEDIRQYTAISEKPVPSQSKPLSPGNAGLSSAAPLLLIVEDNEEVRSFIEGIFKTEYRLLSAVNGEEGLVKAAKTAPDLVISDVMMPKMDGITLCRKLKTDLSTSHIPVLLLTARTGLIFKLEGLETGADDYLTKPFSPKELKLRVRNLLSVRQKLREKFERISNLSPKEIAVTSADEQFLDLALQVSEEQMGNADFTVEDFARALNVSRPLLFIKIKALTNLTPNNFLKEIRLKRAAQLLKQQKLNISEVAYQVGFRDPRYFSKCFQKSFGQTPTAFTENFSPPGN
ncbi:MAG: two-component regulator propeller domain-containing protein [Phaeodactylibacter sp.]|uniref:hybrid sensor histidine kinase/response regulator transcription factor n=1 Tax=Phaeodactylibacter sp. TaxID=1940289 RepID=UPI0032EC71B4